MGDATLVTAGAIANLINDNPAIPLRARAVQNPPTLDTVKGSADVIVTDPAGGSVIVEGLLTDDAAQSVTVGRVTPTDFVGFSFGNPAPRNWVSGSIQQRTALQNYDTGKDRLDIVIIDTFKGGGLRGQSLIPGTGYANGKQAIDEIAMSCFVNAFTMSSIDNDPNCCAHECGHALLDATHVTGDHTQLMTGGGTIFHMNVDGKQTYQRTGCTL
jgi:hypothetical protein